MSLIHNEKTKLTAAALSNIGTGFILGGFVAPVIGISMRGPSPPTEVENHRVQFGLASDGSRLTFSREADPQDVAAMTLLQSYVTFGLPLIALALAGGAFWLTRAKSHKPADR